MSPSCTRWESHDCVVPAKPRTKIGRDCGGLEEGGRSGEHIEVNPSGRRSREIGHGLHGVREAAKDKELRSPPCCIMDRRTASGQLLRATAASWPEWIEYMQQYEQDLRRIKRPPRRVHRALTARNHHGNLYTQTDGRHVHWESPPWRQVSTGVVTVLTRSTRGTSSVFRMGSGRAGCP